MTKVSRVKKQKRQAAYRASNAALKMLPVCINCGEKGPHFVPPGLGMVGFFGCLKPGQTQEEKDQELRDRQADYALARPVSQELFLQWLKEEKSLMRETFLEDFRNELKKEN